MLEAKSSAVPEASHHEKEVVPEKLGYSDEKKTVEEVPAENLVNPEHKDAVPEEKLHNPEERKDAGPEEKLNNPEGKVALGNFQPFLCVPSCIPALWRCSGAGWFAEGQ
eukprot:13400891-Alexandrium_andersonii.AAC.1